MTDVADMEATVEWLSPEAPPQTQACDVAAKVERIVTRLLEYRPHANAELVRSAFAFEIRVFMLSL